MHLQLKNIGQITDADIRFGDLTVFVGPQATGKRSLSNSSSWWSTWVQFRRR